MYTVRTRYFTGRLSCSIVPFAYVQCMSVQLFWLWSALLRWPHWYRGSFIGFGFGFRHLVHQR